ncbi:MAG: HDIG domain-containing protein [Gemmatimonadales bacterium]|nr:MAG: HDIG domain-containing protein [Gemmatimonadales bacterium]
MSRRKMKAQGRAELALQTLSTPPDQERGWGPRLRHHGARIGLLLVLAAAITFLFPPEPGLDMGRFEVGMVSDEDVIASVSFGVPKNSRELEREREQAAASVPPTFERDGEAAESVQASLEEFFDQVDEAANRDEEPEEALAELLEERGVPASDVQKERLLDPEVRRVLRDAALRSAEELLPRGVLDDGASLEPLVARILEVTPEGQERYISRDAILTAREFYQEASAFLPPDAGSDVDDLLRLALIRFLEPTLRYDQEATERDRDASRRAVPTTRATVLQGEAIVRANQQVGESEVERLQAYEEALRDQGHLEDAGLRLGALAGSVILNLLVLGVLGFYLYLFRPRIYTNYRWVLLQGALILSFAGVAGLVARHGLPVELLPVAFVALASAVLWDGRIALVLTVVLAVLAGIQPPFQSLHAWLPVFVAGAAAALSVRAVRRRAQTWVFIAIIAASYLVTIAMLGLVTGREFQAVATSAGWATGNTVASAILAMGFLPVFEWFTRITTDQTLLEWADPNRPLLKRLSMEAPGTYAHTINVANLSEAAANAIGANGLLCRVGVYYHDVGKMLKPQYFIENQPGGRNPHDKLKPATSATIVREHVTEGLKMAREANLPQVLLDFIPEHHGTQVISYFLEKARAEAEAAGKPPPDPEAFRYPGPRPRSRETAVVMLADSVESATRTLQDPTPERVRNLIETIVDSKVRDGQLDEAPLTLRCMGTIKASFEKVLAGLYHHRIDYPETRHLTESPTGAEKGGGDDSAGAPESGTDPGDAAPGEKGGEKGDEKGDESGGEGRTPEAQPSEDEDRPSPNLRRPTPLDAARTSGAAAPSLFPPEEPDEER